MRTTRRGQRHSFAIEKPGPNPQLWDLFPSAAPEVLTALSPDGAPIVEITVEWRRVSDQAEDRVEPSQAMLEQLRALGYVE